MASMFLCFPDGTMLFYFDEEKKAKPKEVTSDWPGFEEFWLAYPRKTAKAKARTAWNRLKANTELQGKMHQAIGEQKGTEGWRRGVIPHAATWLNGKRWTDDAGGLRPDTRVAAPAGKYAHLGSLSAPGTEQRPLANLFDFQGEEHRSDA